MLTRASVIAAALVAVGGVVGSAVAYDELPTASVRQAAATPAAPPATYVALGSSYAAGPGPSKIDDLACLRTSDNYPHQVAKARHLRLIDASCSGSTTADILHEAQRSKTHRPQIDAVTPDAAVVTITTGGNDIDYVGRLLAESCVNLSPDILGEIGIQTCRRGRPVPPPPTPQRYAALERSMVEVVRAVRARAPKAKILLVEYPPIIVDADVPCPLVPLTPEQTAQTISIFTEMSAATARAAAQTGATLVQASKAGAAHTVCSVDPWVAGFEPPVPYHPNEAGKAGVADLVVDALGDTQG